MKALIVLAAFLAVACAINPAAIYRSKCSEGVSYWCENANHADECGAVDYCIQNAWRGKIVQESEVCQDCETFVNAMDNILKQTSVQSEILEGAKMACSAMESLADLCKSLVEELGPEVLQKLVAGLSDDEVCKVLQFCQEKSSLRSDVNESELCTLCDELMAEANALVSNVTIQQDVENILLQICPYLTEIFPDCTQEVQELFPTIVQYILAYLNPESCTLIGLCPGTTEYNDLVRQVRKLIKREGIDLCSECMATIGAVDSMLSNAAIQEAVRLELDQLCYTLGPAAPVCLFVVNTYTKEIITAIVSYLNPNTFCTEFRFCPSDQNDVRVEADFCSDCKTFVGDIDGLLTNQTVQSMLITDVDDICALLGDFAAPCKSYVDQYAYIVFDTLASVLSPPEICTDLTFCPSSQMKKMKALQKKFSVGGPSKVCMDCEQFFSDVQTKLNDPNVQSDIVNAVEQICTLFGTNADDCRDYVSQYGPEVVQFIISSLDPDSVCNDLGFCMSLMTEKVTGPSKVCMDCQQFMSDVQTKLNDQNVQSTIVMAIESVCTLFGPNADQCRDYVSQYGPEIIQFIVSSLDPFSVCDDLGFCMSSAGPSFTKISKKRVTGPSKVCTDCDQFFTDVQTKLSDPTVQSDIVNAVEQVCTLFGPNADECRDYVDQYGGLVIQFIISSMDPSSVCNELGFCMSISILRQKLSLLGDDCSDCKTFFTDIAGLLVNQTVENMITADLVALCADLGSFADQCNTYVTTYAPLVYSVIASAIDPGSICSLIQFCPANLKAQVPSLPADDCSDCQAFFSDIDDLLTNQTVTNMLTADILLLCDDLGSYADECKSLVNQYAPIVYSLIASSLDPDSVCSLLQFCSSEMALIVKKPSVDSPELCNMCEEVVSSLETYIASQSNQALIIQQLDTLICANLGPLSITCKGIVKTYTPIVINLLLSYAKPLTLCTEIMMCPGASSIQIPADPKICADCEAFLGDIDSMISNQTFQNEVTAQLEALCSMAGSLEAECKLLIETYAPTIFAVLLANLDPTTDCTDFGLCPGMSLPKISVADPQLCSDCKNFLTDIDTILSNQTLQKEVITELESLCSMAGSLQAECKLLVATYGPAAFAYLLSELDPTTACTEIGVCPGLSAPALTQKQIALVPAVQPMASLQAAKPIPQKQTPVKVGDVDCDLCKTIVGIFAQYLESNKTEAEILDLIAGFCDVLSGETAQECHNMVEVYGSIIFELLKSEFSPEEVCQEIGQCSSLMATKPVKHLKQLLSRLPLKDDTLCTLCEIGIGELETILESNKSKEEIKQEVEKLICSNIPSPINTQCLSFMEIYGDVLIQLLIEQLEPSSFCAEIGFCPSQKKPVLKYDKKPLHASPECILCEYIVSYLDSTLEDNSTEEEIIKAVESVCSYLPSTLKTECDSFIKEYGEVIITYLVHSFSPSALCSAIGVCSTEYKKKPLQDATECALCEFIVSELDSTLQENSTEEEIVKAVESVCSFLPSTIKTECDTLIEEYGADIITYLVDEFSPSALCSAIGLCSSGETVVLSKETPSTNCVLCEYVMSEIDNILTENSTEEEIEEAVETVCSFLPDTIQAECDTFVTDFAPYLISYLTQKLNPAEFCTIIGECQGKALPKAKKPVKESSCVLCEFVMSELDKLLEENSTQAEIKSALDKVCSQLPSSVTAECELFVSEYEAKLIDLLANESTSVICTDLGLCNSFKALRVLPKAKKPVTESSCVLCEFVMKELDELLEENSTQAEIKSALDKVCSQLPSTITAECKLFVAEYEGELIQLLANESTEVICSKLGLCNGLKAVRAVRGTIECDLCQTAVREFMNALQEPSVTKEIVVIVNETCAILPDNLKAECYTYVNQYGDLVTQFIAQFFDPITSCTLLEACPYPDNSPRKALLGQHECTRGPGYWCASMENAKYCNMVEHCKRHAWN